MNKKYQKDNNGFTILFAVLVSTLILAVGASIINIALKQLTLSGSARDSQFAFYAANTGIECALYWDFNGVNNVTTPVFATSSDTLGGSYVIDLYDSVKCADEFIVDGTSVAANESDVDYSCSENSLYKDTGWCVEDSAESATTSFRVQLSDVEYCVDVNVSKFLDENDRTRTIIDSRGYNTCDEDNQRRVERGLRISY